MWDMWDRHKYCMCTVKPLSQYVIRTPPGPPLTVLYHGGVLILEESLVRTLSDC